MILNLSPTIIRKIWGGNRLEVLKQLPSDFSANAIKVAPIGETWEVYLERLPFLAKFIDTSQELSIQVHPGDEYARMYEAALGKTECWVILEAAVGEGIYLGLKPGVTKPKLIEAIEQKQSIEQLLNFHPVKSGDFFFVPAGSIHAIGKNITLAEVQQNSGITYRVWDWNRVDEAGVGRELHVDKSLEVISFDPAKNELNFFQKKEDLFEIHGLKELCSHSHFHLFMLNLDKDEKYNQKIKLYRPCAILNLSGSKKINNVSLAAYSAVLVEDEVDLTIESLESGSLLLIF